MASDIVGTVRVRVIADTAQYDASMNSIGNSAEKTSNKINNHLNGISKVGAVAFGALATLGQKAFNAITSSLDSAVKRVDVLNNFPKVMSNLGVSSEQASSIIKDLSDKLQGLPTTLNDAASAVQRLTAKNGDISKSEKYFLAMNDAIIAGGQSADIQQTAIEQLSQAYSKGKPDMMEWRSLMTAMPAQLNQVAQAMGYGANSADALGEDLRSGKVSMEDFMTAMVELDTNGGSGITSFAQQAKDATGGIQTTITNMQTAITRGVASVIDSIGSENIQSIATDLGNAFEKAGKIIGSIINFIKDNKEVFQTLAVALGAVVTVTTAWNAIQAILNSTLLANPILAIVAAVAALVAAVVYFFTQTELGRQIVQDVVNAIGAAWQWLCNTVSGVVNAIAGFFTGLWNNIVNIFNAIWQFLQEWGLTILGIILGPVTGAIVIYYQFKDQIDAIFWSVVNSIKGAFSSVVGWIQGNVINPIVNFFNGLWNAIVNGVNGAVNTIRNVLGSVAGFVKAPFNGIINAMNGVIGTINSIRVPDWVPGIGGQSMNIPQIPYLAKGGIVGGATLAMIGESGREAVLPLEHNTGWATELLDVIMSEMDGNTTTRGGVTVTQNVTANTPVDLQIINQQLGSAIRRVTA